MVILLYRIDYHTHPYSHGEDRVQPIHNLDILKKFVDNARKNNINEIAFTDHDDFIELFNWDNLTYIKNNADMIIKLGIEIDFQLNKIEDIKETISKYPFDFVIGSVHKVRDWEIDHPDYIYNYNNWNIDNLYEKYFSLIIKATESALFDIIGHIDLIKIFNFFPEKKSIMEYIERPLKVIKDNGLAIEINTNGLNKAVNEVYPGLDILKRACELEIPITTGSDAHQPGRVGENFDHIYNLLINIGYKEIVTFNQREKIKIKIR